MILRALVAALILAPGMAFADAATLARDAARHLEGAAWSLEQAETKRDRIAALTDTVRGYEKGLAALREALRVAVLEERAMRNQYGDHAAELSQLLATLQTIERSGGAAALIHPEGALPAIRAGMLTADLVPALSARANTLAAELADLNAVVTLQRNAETQLEDGLTAIRDARLALAQAISNRDTLPRRVSTDDAAIQALVNSAETLDAFASSLSTARPTSPTDAEPWPLPVLGTPIRGYNDPDAEGIRRPGWTLATDPEALVTAPADATVRFTGPLLDQGRVVIMEPRAGELLILTGLDRIYARRGEILSKGAPLGQMGGRSPEPDQKLNESARDGGQRRPETLYIEVRLGGDTVDPTTRFGEVAE